VVVACFLGGIVLRLPTGPKNDITSANSKVRGSMESKEDQDYGCSPTNEFGDKFGVKFGDNFFPPIEGNLILRLVTL
jgi:hypothetical protein